MSRAEGSLEGHNRLVERPRACGARPLTSNVKATGLRTALYGGVISAPNFRTWPGAAYRGPINTVHSISLNLAPSQGTTRDFLAQNL